MTCVARAAESGHPGAKPKADAIIHIYLPGGIAAQESWDPKLLAPVEYRGPLGTVKTRIDGAQFSEHLQKTAQIADSLKAGRQVLQELAEVNALHKRDVEQAGFAVLKAPDVPSILVETAFISNPDEEAKLRDPRHQARYAESIADGVRRYFAKHPTLRAG